MATSLVEKLLGLSIGSYSLFWILSGLSITSFLALLAILLFYIYTIYPFIVFRRDGIPGPVPWPIIGTMFTIFRKGVTEADKEILSKYGEVVGTYEGRTPALLVKNQDLLKQILIKEFHYFPDRRGGNMSFPMRKSLPSLRGNHWKRIRSQLTPFFSNAKLKFLIPRVTVCAKIMTENLRFATRNDSIIDLTRFCRSFSMDSIAATSFGLSIDSQNSQSDPFVIHADKIFNFKPSMILSAVMLLLPSSYPYLKKIGFEMFPEDSAKFFVQVLDDTIKQRSVSEENQGDFLQMMLHLNEKEKLKNGEKKNGEQKNTFHNLQKGLSHEEILAQCIVFLLAGYETTATTLTMATYCLATNLEYQEKVFQEIYSLWDGKSLLTLEQLCEMKELDCFLHEVLRFYPPVTRVNRICSEDINIDSCKIRKGSVVIIPIFSIHHDATWWENPEQFIPERFNQCKKNGTSMNQNNGSLKWLPFGGGPRHCIGMRLALLELKIALAHLLMNFQLLSCDQTQIPIKFTKRPILQPEKGVTVSILSRNRFEVEE